MDSLFKGENRQNILMSSDTQQEAGLCISAISSYNNVPPYLTTASQNDTVFSRIWKSPF